MTRDRVFTAFVWEHEIWDIRERECFWVWDMWGSVLCICASTAQNQAQNFVITNTTQQKHKQNKGTVFDDTISAVGYNVGAPLP